MDIRIVDHPLVAAKLTELRDERTGTITFRRLCDELVTLLAYEATRDMHVRAVGVTTPVGPTDGVALSGPPPLVVPILRAGLGMLDGMLRLLPGADVGFLGMVRDEGTLIASTYADRIPVDLREREVFLLDPMLATGGTLSTAISLLRERGAASITAVCLIAAPEGIAHLRSEIGSASTVTIVAAGLDERLNDVGYIVPGLGDAGDRLFGPA